MKPEGETLPQWERRDKNRVLRTVACYSVNGGDFERPA
jgi:hypothetical protein